MLKTIRITTLATLAALALPLAVLPACEEKSATEEAAEDLGDALEDAGDAMEEAAEDATDAVEDATDGE